MYLSVLPCKNTTQWPQPGLEPGLPDAESGALTIRPLRLPMGKIHFGIGVRAIFYQGGGESFAQKILASCPNFYEKVEKKRGSYTML